MVRIDTFEMVDVVLSDDELNCMEGGNGILFSIEDGYTILAYHGIDAEGISGIDQKCAFVPNTIDSLRDGEAREWSVRGSNKMITMMLEE